MNGKRQQFRFETLVLEAGPGSAPGSALDGAALVVAMNGMLDDGYTSGEVGQLLLAAASVLAVNDGVPGEQMVLMLLVALGGARRATAANKAAGPPLVLVPGREVD